VPTAASAGGAERGTGLGAGPPEALAPAAEFSSELGSFTTAADSARERCAWRCGDVPSRSAPSDTVDMYMSDVPLLVRSRRSKFKSVTAVGLSGASPLNLSTETLASSSSSSTRREDW
jgi:hypothetical protein